LPCQLPKKIRARLLCPHGKTKKPQDLSHGFNKEKAMGAAAHGLPSFMRLNLASGQAMGSS